MSGDLLLLIPLALHTLSAFCIIAALHFARVLLWNAAIFWALIALWVQP